MLWIQIFSSIIAAIAALLGIWSASNINRNIAVISSIIVIVGLVLGVVLMLLQDKDAEVKIKEEVARHENLILSNNFLREQIDAIKTTTPLTSLKITWEIPTKTIGNKLRQINGLSNSISHKIRVSDDEIDRLGGELHRKMLSSWDINFGYSARLLTIADPTLDLSTLYSKETFSEADKIERGDYEDSLEVGGGEYTGPRVRLWFPLNLTRNSAISLGNKEDDSSGITSDIDRYPAEEFYSSVADFGFDLNQNLFDEKLTFVWEYKEASLEKAVFGQKPTLAFPSSFNMLLVINDSATYFNSVKNLFSGNCAGLTEPHSRLVIVYNGLESHSITYQVYKGERTELREHLSAYDPDELAFEYFPFTLCRESNGNNKPVD